MAMKLTKKQLAARKESEIARTFTANGKKVRKAESKKLQSIASGKTKVEVVSTNRKLQSGVIPSPVKLVNLSKSKPASYTHGCNQYKMLYTDDEIEKLADEMIEWFTSEENHVWLNDFATSRLLTRNQLYTFSKRNAKFAHIYAVCKEIQERRLFDAGRVDKSPTMAVFALKNISGWRDTQEIVTHDAKRAPFEALTTEQIQEKIARISKG